MPLRQTAKQILAKINSHKSTLVIALGTLIIGVAGFFAVGSRAAADASLRDQPIASHNIVRAYPSSPDVVVRDASGQPLHDPNGQIYRVGSGAVRVQSIGPAVYSPDNHLMVWVWGTNSHTGSVIGKSGFVYASDLRDAPGSYRILRHTIGAIGENGLPLDGALGQVTAMEVIPKPLAGYFLSVRQPLHVLGLHTYGQKDGNPNYAYLTYNLPDVAGGGMVRSILSVGDQFYASGLRKQVTMVDKNGNSTGQGLEFVYGYALQNGQEVWGWVAAYNILLRP